MYCVLGVDLVPIEVRRVSEPLEQVVVMGCWRLNQGPSARRKSTLNCRAQPIYLKLFK